MVPVLDAARELPVAVAKHLQVAARSEAGVEIVQGFLPAAVPERDGWIIRPAAGSSNNGDVIRARNIAGRRKCVPSARTLMGRSLKVSRVAAIEVASRWPGALWRLAVAVTDEGCYGDVGGERKRRWSGGGTRAPPGDGRGRRGPSACEKRPSSVRWCAMWLLGWIGSRQRKLQLRRVMG